MYLRVAVKVKTRFHNMRGRKVIFTTPRGRRVSRLFVSANKFGYTGYLFYVRGVECSPVYKWEKE